jgi:hypothetical protein
VVSRAEVKRTKSAIAVAGLRRALVMRTTVMPFSLNSVITSMMSRVVPLWLMATNTSPFFKIEIEVFHNDRDIEFIQFKRWLESLYANGTLQLDYKSCEMICDELAEIINSKYPNRKLNIKVSEDNENGASCSYE